MRIFKSKQNRPQERARSSLARSNPLHHSSEDAPRSQPATSGTSPSLGHDFSRISIHPPALGAIQSKLAINTTGDEYEQEADRISQQVMRMSEARTQQPAEEDVNLGIKPMQPGDGAHTAPPPSVHEVVRSPGQPL